MHLCRGLNADVWEPYLLNLKSSMIENYIGSMWNLEGYWELYLLNLEFVAIELYSLNLEIWKLIENYIRSI